MASNINPFNVDGTFPIAGQDNPSQGFRDNFTNLRNNLGYAKSEIEDLQNKAILKTSLTGGTLSNDMGGSVLYQPTLKSYYETLYDQGLLSGEVTLNYANGNIQKVSTAGACSLAFTGWPESGIFGKIILWFNVLSDGHNLSFPTTSPGVTIGITNIAGFDGIDTVTFDTNNDGGFGDYVFEFSTIDGGTNIMVRDLTRNYNNFRGSNFYFNSDVSDTVFVGFNNGLTNARTQVENNTDNKLSVFGVYNSVSVGNIAATANVGGYSITAARGNIQTDTTFDDQNAVSAGDYLGQFNALAFTGNGTGNTFTQLSSISFHATGNGSATSYTYGVGGNIAIYTKADSGLLRQAVGIENDQSIKFFGGIFTTPNTPSGPSAAGTAGQIAVDANYVYVCTATNTWKRVAITSAGW
jgi:hypothetical protein